MKRLITNADDFGVTHGVNRGIVRCHREGIVTSTTIMANGDAFEDAAQLARDNLNLGVGVHVVLVGGRAVGARGEIGELADSKGELPRTLSALLRKCATGKVQQRQIEREIAAQIERVVASGIQPTHLDTHKHTHMYPPVMKALAKVAGDYGIRNVRMPFENLRGVIRRMGSVRLASLGRSTFVLSVQGSRSHFRRYARATQLRTPDHFFGFAVTGQLARDGVLRILRQMPEGTSELMCHPGINDADLEAQPTRLKKERETELAALTDADVKKEIAERGIHLISYRELN
jgi:chitin disaccharide deacetylase